MGIRWKRGDYITLGKAVSNFNKKINDLNKLEKKNYLPQKVSYNDIKNKIYTRNEYNRVLKSLKDFNKEGAEEKVLINNVETTKWQQNEFIKLKRNAVRNLNFDLKEMEQIAPHSTKSKAQMGFREYEEVLDRIRNIKDLEIKTKGDFTRLKDRLENLGNLDYRYMKATIFRQNFLTALESSQELKGYEEFKNKLDRFKSPVAFYNYVKKSDILMDIFLYYKPGDGIIYGGFDSDQERFYNAMEEVGFFKDEKEKLLKGIEKRGSFFGRNVDLNTINSLSNAEELINFLEQNK